MIIREEKDIEEDQLQMIWFEYLMSIFNVAKKNVKKNHFLKNSQDEDDSDSGEVAGVTLAWASPFDVGK